jgi:hypothetical protein
MDRKIMLLGGCALQAFTLNLWKDAGALHTLDIYACSVTIWRDQ